MDVIDRLFGVAGKSVLITGGSRGIGLAIATGFVRAGARVYISSRKASACEAAAEQLSELGSCWALPADVATAAGREQLVRCLAEREDSLDVLVNNAGTMWAAPLDDYPESGWDKVFDLNVKGLFYLVTALTPTLSRAGSPGSPARIINIGSIDGLHVPAHETYAYSASKAGAHHLARHLAARLAGSNINVNVIAPGMFLSKMLEETLNRHGADAMLSRTPIKRFVEADDMAGAAIYLASRASSYVTGSVITVDGGTATTL
jgi:NAD(P)-dependent dehydrogenase (short-subunit alcohol dehydrogenase family)